MKVTITTDKHSRIDLKKAFSSIRSSYVKAGVLGKAGPHSGKLTNAQLASIHEFGLGNAPARPFIGPPFRAKRAEYLAMLEKAYLEFLKNSGKPEIFRHALELSGQKMVADIRAYVTAGPGVPPPNSPATIARKGSSRPLVDTGQMVRSTDYVVIWNGPKTSRAPTGDAPMTEAQARAAGLSVETGPKGGKFYVNRFGNKTYFAKHDTRRNG